MIHIPLFALFLGVLPPANVPFTVQAVEDVSSQFPGAPHLQSFSFAQWKGRWVFIGGRIAGYHASGGAPAEFLRADSNREVWVVDTTVQPARTYHAPLDQLPASLEMVKDQWASAGQLYYQDGSKLYIAGGYGQDHTGEWQTFPLLSQADLPQLIAGVMKGRVPAEAIATAQTPLVQSAGGELIKLADGHFYVVMGHVFTGSYTAFEGQGEHNTHKVSQAYLNEIRKLKVTSAGSAALNVTLVEKFQNADEFHRRDLNVVQVLSPKGLGLAAYGGVFTPDTQLAYTKPVYLFGNSRPTVDATFEQKMNSYSSARLLIYDKVAETMYTTLFGGISGYIWDNAAGKFVLNAKVGSKSEPVYRDGLQWSDQISTIRRVMSAGKEQTVEMVHSCPMPGFLGSGAVFIPAPEIAKAHPDSDILDMAAFHEGATFAGYIYGGIRAFPYQFPYSKTSTPHNSGVVPTQPSELILKVYVRLEQR